MGFKGIYQHKSSRFKFLILLSLIFISVIAHMLLAIGFVFLFFDNGIMLIQNQDLSNQASVNYLKLMQLFSGIGLFITPLLLYSYLTNFNFSLIKSSAKGLMLVGVIIVLITPFIALLLEWNRMIPLPDWVLKFDVNSEAFLIAFLKMDSVLELLYTLLVIAVVPAIGEELLFRGYLQKKIGQRLGNMHISILITGFLFSAIHFHFEGIIPRFVLGVLLGYIFYWGKNLWLPIFAHFVNNAQAVIFYYPLFEVENSLYSISSEEKVMPMLAVLSLISAVGVLYIFYCSTKKD